MPTLGEKVRMLRKKAGLTLEQFAEQIKAGERVPLTLSFTAADGSVSKIEVNATAGFTPPTR